MNKIKKVIRKSFFVFEHFIFRLIYGTVREYGEIGYFVKSQPITIKYSYANWGSRLWEIKLIKNWLEIINIKDKKIVDIGIGLPSDSDFYKYYIRSGCYLNAYDLDPRIKDQIKLSNKCTLYNKSSDNMSENEDNSVDVVVALSSLEHYPIDSFNKTIKEVSRILKPNGHFLVTLDLTYNKTQSAPWAILEKTINGLPAEENNLKLKDNDSQITLEKFIEMVSPWFYTKEGKINNSDKINSKMLLRSEKWNSYISYVHIYKR